MEHGGIIGFFLRVDANNSGSLDVKEVSALLKSFNFHLSLSTVQPYMAIFDFDKSERIEYNEFLFILNSLMDDVKGRYLDLTNFPIMCAKENLAEQYVPPSKGILHLDLKHFYLKELLKKY